ncbi:hypothetical protein DICVIV_08045 [Dictyocaulus viviparus]|uniref:Uncharacterized protein n=1 Tax=Dictyocaulus viviparus TaxID=29172 RepID=A0A0D8XMY1_DICVI|nr:hypothetical protein DICVIV_08045 [Dictyocaulus viviparus]
MISSVKSETITVNSNTWSNDCLGTRTSIVVLAKKIQIIIVFINNSYCFHCFHDTVIKEEISGKVIIIVEYAKMTGYTKKGMMKARRSNTKLNQLVILIEKKTPITVNAAIIAISTVAVVPSVHCDKRGPCSLSISGQFLNRSRARRYAPTNNHYIVLLANDCLKV